MTFKITHTVRHFEDGELAVKSRKDGSDDWLVITPEKYPELAARFGFEGAKKEGCVFVLPNGQKLECGETAVLEVTVRR